MARIHDHLPFGGTRLNSVALNTVPVSMASLVNTTPVAIHPLVGGFGIGSKEFLPSLSVTAMFRYGSFGSSVNTTELPGVTKISQG